MTATPTSVDVVILGGGAAGLMCAATAGRRGRSVVVVERNAALGRKILISGGGRCNFTNTGTRPDCFLSNNPHFAKSALQRYTPQDFIGMVDRHGIAWHEKTLGQLFCDGSARQIVRMLEQQCTEAQVRMKMSSEARSIERAGDRFHIALDDETLHASALVIATGGPSIPKIGATGAAYDIAQRFRLAVVTPRPALVPLTLGIDDAAFTALPGVATDAIASIGKTAFREAFLFTHRGLSGPAILQISSYWAPGRTVAINMTPAARPGWLIDAKAREPRGSLRNAIAGQVPQRLADALHTIVTTAGPKRPNLAAWPDKGLREIEQRLAAWAFNPTGTEGYAKAEVTAGGIDTKELSSKTMEARSVPGLFAIGEAVDVTGWLGGYNFQWAWASGHAAGEAV